MSPAGAGVEPVVAEPERVANVADGRRQELGERSGGDVSRRGDDPDGVEIGRRALDDPQEKEAASPHDEQAGALVALVEEFPQCRERVLKCFTLEHIVRITCVIRTC